MKRNFIAACIAVLISLGSFAQTNNQPKTTTKTESFKVWGTCDMCKARIEKAAKIEGVTKAEWKEQTKMLTLTFNPAKVKADQVQKNLALAGHDTPKYKATDKAYAALPGCCHYDRK